MKNKGLNVGLLLLRFSLGAMMLLHGVSKMVHGLGGIKSMLLKEGLPEFFAYGVLVGEIVAPILILLGVRTRLFSAVFAFNMLVAIAMAHSGGIFSLNNTGGWGIELPALYFFGALVLVFTGSGKYALSSSKLFD